MNKKNIRSIAIILITLLIIILTLIWIDWGHQLQIGSLVVNDIFSAVVSIILGAFVTMALLYAQTINEDNRNKGSVIFEEKLKTFTNFLEIFGDFMKDGQLEKEEIRVLILKHSLVNINLSPTNQKAFNKVFSNIKAELFYENENGVPEYQALGDLYSEIANVFRAELYGTKITKWESLNFDNFTEISSKTRSKPIFINNFEDFLKELTPGRDIFFTVTLKDGRRQNYKFKLKLEASDNYKVTFEYVSKVITDNILNIETKFEIEENKTYQSKALNNPKIRFYFQHEELMRIGITTRNRVELHLLKNKETIKRYSLETLNEELLGPKNIQKYIPIDDLLKHIHNFINEVSKNLDTNKI